MRAAPHPAQSLTSIVAELAKVVWSEVGQLVLLPVKPQVFDRIQLWRLQYAALPGKARTPVTRKSNRIEGSPRELHG